MQINQINTFIGRDQHKSVDENFNLLRLIWKPLIEFAEDKKYMNQFILQIITDYVKLFSPKKI